MTTKTYFVTIRATITKTLKVQALNEDHAAECAHEEFTLEADSEERYEQDTLHISEREE